MGTDIALDGPRLSVTSTFAGMWKSVALRGVAALAVGLAALFWPGMPLTALVLLIGLYVLADGIVAIATGMTRHASRHVAWALVLQGASGVALGLVVLLGSNTAVVRLAGIVALWAVASGALQMLTALHLRRELPRESMLGLAGTASIVLGIAMLLWPNAAATPLVVLFGSYALVFGAAMLAQANRLRKVFKETHGRSHRIDRQPPAPRAFNVRKGNLRGPGLGL
jgi:uncharacterized membrane protein HdeD (DUF308 family)